ncbi:ABC transporter transmembrane domain-containing protein [Haliea sp. E17]|uniref:ABC transporter transmembrane domain-containing protein n=1 Tax=Haliea sp. E17 TaxID=3401576 RepID=UPI003AAD0E2C
MSASGKPRKLSSLKKLMPFILPYRRQATGAAAALVFTAAITLTLGQGVKALIDQGFVAGSMGNLNRITLVMIGLIILMSAGTFIRFYLVSWIGERVTADLRKAVFDHIVALHPDYFETNRSGEIMSRLTTDTTLLQNIIGSTASMALRSTLTTIGGLAMLVITNLKLSLIVITCVPLIVLPVILFGRRVRKLSRQSQDSVADVGSHAGETIQHIKTVQSYTREDAERQAFAADVERAFHIARRRIRQRALLMLTAILLVYASITGMLWVGGSDVLQGTMTAGELGAFVFYAIIVAAGVGTLSEVFGELQRAGGATERLMELLAVQSHIAEPAQPIADVASLPATMALQNLTFHYPSRPDTAALHAINLHIEEGKSLALVGPSGAGKSTVFELLLRFYDPQEGAILFGGRDIRQFRLRDLRSAIALVPQQPALFTADVAYNIRYGRLDASDEEVIAAARAAYAHEFIERLPQQYQSHLGEKGVRLSGGQRQRIAIARAILNNPRLLLLDEATSALDSESEQKVQLALAELMHNRTTVIIAHRLSTIQHADRIAVLDHGRVVATGTHEELLQSSELYQRLYQLQFREVEASPAEAPPAPL